MRLLSLCPVQILRLFWIVQPLGWASLYAQRIEQQSHNDPKREHEYCIKDRQQDASLEISNLLRDSLPALPQPCKQEGVLEKGVHEWAYERALSNDDQHSKNKKGQEHRQEPPAFI